MTIQNLETMPKLGMGMMRLPLRDEIIDIEQVKHMVDHYLENGLNYFDTAYVYHGGKSEGALKEALVTRYPRESFYLADKLPAWAMKTKEDRDRILKEQLDRLGTDYIDFYLLHAVEDGTNYNTYVDLDCFEWAKQKKAEGKIRHFGFSFHGTPELLEEILGQHPEVEFVQIQLNYLDWDNPVVQSGRLYEILRSRNIPMIIMEPVKGGTLANLDDEVSNILTAIHPDHSQASWAIRFAAGLPGVMTVLSGMSSEEQLKDNVNTITHFESLNDQERKAIEEVVYILSHRNTVPCTGCSYCIDGCPSKIHIPNLFKALNLARMYPDSLNGPKKLYKQMIEAGESGLASSCIACGQCESVCPQHLPIIKLIAETANKLEN
ncbi:aldo/keto reductase [Ileibacterium valens]|uniref:aldo/keto reductase n=1 Tax=Ileibacterium valens TaxID=1862668 RepID=UPI00272D0E9F|nr:aldo/keto reductase [Ileibacterium valens]